MRTSARVGAALLPHVNLLLTVLSGAGLAMAARLKWDPSLYIVVRELMPAEYRVLGGALAGGSLALLLLAHAAAAGLAARRACPRRTLLIGYAVCMSALLAAELALAAWVTARALQWLHSEEVRALHEALAHSEELRVLLAYLARLHPLPDKISRLIEEAKEDLPRNAYCALALALVAVLLQPVGAVLAALAARDAPADASAPSPGRRARSFDGASGVSSSSDTALLYSGGDSPRPRVRAEYRGGRLVLM